MQSCYVYSLTWAHPNKGELRGSTFTVLSPNRDFRVVGFKNWKHPFHENYLGIGGAKGRFLGFWAVIMQAAFSFFGSEVPGIVRPAHINPLGR